MKEPKPPFFGDRLKLARNLHGLTLRRLGQQCTCSAQYLSHLENGRKQPNQEFVDVLAEALGVLPGFFERPVEPIAHMPWWDTCFCRSRSRL